MLNLNEKVNYILQLVHGIIYCACALNRVQMAARDPWHQEHPAHLMVILKSKKEELLRFFLLLASKKSQATSFAVYDWLDYL